MDIGTIIWGSVFCLITLALIRPFMYIVYRIFSDISLKNSGIPAKATVADVKRVRIKGRGSVYCIPLLEYYVDGQVYTKTYSVLKAILQYRIMSYHKGQEVDIMYNYNNPHRIVVEGGINKGMALLMLIGICLMYFGSGIFSMTVFFIQKLIQR